MRLGLILLLVVLMELRPGPAPVRADGTIPPDAPWCDPCLTKRVYLPIVVVGN